MKKLVKYSIVLIVLLCAGLWFYYYMDETDEERITENFNDFAQYSSKNPDEGLTSAIYKISALRKLFDERCMLEVKNEFLAGEYSREEIGSKALMAKKHFESVAIRFYELDISIEPDSGKARVSFTARLTGRLKNGGRDIDEARELEASLVKKEGKWLFTDFKVKNILEK